MLGGLILMTILVSALVAFSRYREAKQQRFRQECSYRPDETAKHFAEQWSIHPTLTRRQAKALKRDMRKRNRG